MSTNQERSAQPSPGGQGDAPNELQRYSPDPENTEYGWMQGMKEDTAMGEWVHIEDIRALAARQPVGATGKNSLTVGGGQEPVAYLDLGEGGYMDVGTDLSDEELAALPKGRHMLGIIGTYGVDGYKPAQAVDHEVTDAMVDKAWNRFEAALHADDGDTPEDRVLSETIDQRDRYHEMADELAGHIARIIGVDIGEHSSANCPWQNAIEAAEEYKPAQAVDLAENMLSVLIEEGVLARNGRVFQKLRALIDSKAS